MHVQTSFSNDACWNWITDIRHIIIFLQDVRCLNSRLHEKCKGRRKINSTFILEYVICADTFLKHVVCTFNRISDLTRVIILRFKMP